MIPRYTKIYKCELSGDNNMISYDIDNDKATMTFVAIDHKNMKLFFQLLKSSLNDISTKDIKYINQYINIEEWSYLKGKRTSWTIINEFKEEYLIECPMEDAIENIGIAFGIDKNLQI